MHDHPDFPSSLSEVSGKARRCELDVSGYRFLEDEGVLYTRQRPKPSRIDVGLNELKMAERQESCGMEPQKGTGQRVGKGGPDVCCPWTSCTRQQPMTAST